MTPVLRMLFGALRLLLQLLAIAMIGRWAVMRLRRVMLLPTGDSTPPIRDTQSLQRRRLILSDWHLGGGDRLDDFDADADLAAFIRQYALSDEPTELILAGDTFEFLQVRLPGLGDYEWSGEAAVRRLQAILSAHPEPIAALREFVSRPENQLTLLIGNHDFEMHYAVAKRHLRQALGLDESDQRLRFGINYEGGGVYIEHGNQFDPWNSFIHFEGISEPFEVVRGTRVVKDVINPLEDDPLPIAPLMDNVKPVSAFFWYVMALPRLRQPMVRHFAVRGLLMFFRTVALPRMYHRPILNVREELLGAPGETLQRELALQAVYEAEPELRRAAAVNYGGIEPQVQLRQRKGLQGGGLAQTFARRLGREREPSETMLTQIEQEAGRQLRREIREFKGAILQAIVRIAASPVHSHNTLFVCGHTHLAQVVPLNERQTYVNTGTWTTIVLDIATDRRQEQRFPFLEVRRSAADDAPQGQLLVWRGVDVEPQPWNGGIEIEDEGL